MSVIAEFTLPVDAFPFGRALCPVGGMTIELERIVPLAGAHIPYVWVGGGNVEAFERAVGEDEHVDAITRLDRVDGRALYRVEWAETESGLINGVREAEATVMEATGGETWQFRLHFLDHDRLRRFYNYCTEHALPIHLDRVYTPDETSGPGLAFDLTAEQREALVLALRRGYFATPREVGLADLAAKLGVSKQAVSQRVRKATEAVLREAMLPSTEDG